MNKLIIFTCLCLSFSGYSQDIFGKWKTIDDQTGEAKSIVEIYKKDRKVFGKIIEIFDETKSGYPCIKCKGDDYNKPVLGLDIIKNMNQDGNYYNGGTVVDPQNGKVYKLRLAVTDKDQLQVRGYVGFFFSTQYWIRVE